MPHRSLRCARVGWGLSWDSLLGGCSLMGPSQWRAAIRSCSINLAERIARGMERHPLYDLLLETHHRGGMDDVLAVAVVDPVEVPRQADALGLGRLEQRRRHELDGHQAVAGDRQVRDLAPSRPLLEELGGDLVEVLG